MANTKLTTQLRKHIASSNTVETGKSSVGDFTREFSDSVKQSVAPIPDTFLNQLLGVDSADTQPQQKHQSVEMKAGEEFILPKSQKKELPQPERRPHIEAGISYHRDIVHNRERMSGQESQETKYQIQQIMEELQRLVSSSDQIIQMTYGEISVASSPTVVGKYHTNFFSWMLTVIRTARQKVEESGAWLSVAKGKGSRKGYQNMSKKHGTSFSMSNERTVATQSG